MRRSLYVVYIVVIEVIRTLTLFWLIYLFLNSTTGFRKDYNIRTRFPKNTLSTTILSNMILLATITAFLTTIIVFFFNFLSNA